MLQLLRRSQEVKGRTDLLISVAGQRGLHLSPIQPGMVDTDIAT